METKYGCAPFGPCSSYQDVNETKYNECLHQKLTYE